MDPLIAAGQKLAHGDPLDALRHVGLRDDAAGLALRGIALAQLGDLARARMLLRRARLAFAPDATVARARCVLAEAEVALAAREFAWPATLLSDAQATLAAQGDRLNAAHAQGLAARRLLLLGRLDEAALALAAIEPGALPPLLRATHDLLLAGVALRRQQAGAARKALGRARGAAMAAGAPALLAEIDRHAGDLERPAARLQADGQDRLLSLDEVEAVLDSDALVVDARGHVVRRSSHHVALATRPVLFRLVRALATAWPADVPRAALMLQAFGARHADESHRARLRVEIGRLRRALRGLAQPRATKAGFVLAPQAAPEVLILSHPVEEAHAVLMACLADGEAWASSALALVLGTSQRSVQRALDELHAAGKVASLGRGRARRWTLPPPAGFATSLLLTIPGGFRVNGSS